MQLFGIIYVLMILGLGLFLTIGSYILHRDKDLRRIWEEMGKPEVRSVKELKALIRQQEDSDFSYSRETEAS